MLIDTHCHLDFEDFDIDRDDVIYRAKEKGVKYLVNIGSSIEGTRRSIELAKKYENIYASCGIHPHYADKIDERVWNELRTLAESTNKVVAIGEIGLDYFKSNIEPDVQKTVFKKFMALALGSNLPIIIHNRDAHADTLECLSGFQSENLRGVVHCFSGDEDYLKRCISMGCYVSFCCNITYKNAHNLRHLVEKTPIERVLLETDAPFLSPQALRGKRNEPANLVYLVEELAKLKNLSQEDIARITTLNANLLFGIGKPDKKGKIAYNIRDSLYLNITNRCSNNCSFCVRTFTDYVKGYNLRLEKEPTVEEILEVVRDEAGDYREVVFCGFGEPTYRVDVIVAVSKELKKEGKYMRLDTNGEGNLINQRSIAKELRGLIDEVCVSLNTESAEKYNKLCNPQFGENTYDKIKEFILECKQHIPKVSITCIDMHGIDLKVCEKIAKEELGVGFRIRGYNETG